MSISSDDNRDRPEIEAGVGRPHQQPAPEFWEEYEADAPDPLVEPPREPISREADDRERWMRDYIDREQRFRLYFSKYIAGLLNNPSRGMRWWRWLIDDFRSERREQAMYFNGGREAGLLPWIRRRMTGGR